MLNTALGENKETIVLGDINCNYLQQKKQPEVKRTLRMHGLKQIVQNATRVTKETSTLIDVIATTHEHNVAKQITEPISISDHDLTGVVIKRTVTNSSQERSSHVIMQNTIASGTILRVPHGNRFLLKET